MSKKSLELYKKHLPEGYSESFRIDGIDHLDIPIFDTTLFTDGGQNAVNGVGYGKTSVEAETGAYGELYEEYYNPKKVSALEKKAASYRQMTEDYGTSQVINPLTLVLPAGSEYHPELELQWVEIDKYGQNEDAYWIPVEFVSSKNAATKYPNQLITSITNADGAGDTWERAVLHALLELLQRDGNADCFRALDRGIVIELDEIDPAITELLDHLEAKGLEIILKLARVTTGCVSVYAVGVDTSSEEFPLCAAACGEAADPSINVALRKAILECASSHTRKLFAHSPMERKKSLVPDGYWERNVEALDLDKEEKRALKTMTEWISSEKSDIAALLKDTVYSQKETVPASSLPNRIFDTLTDKLDYVLAEYKKEGFEIFHLMCTPEDAPIKVVKVIVPGIEMEFGSYHRIGYRGVKRLLEIDSPLISTTMGDGKLPIPLSQEQTLALGQPYFLNVEKLDALIEDLYPLYREPTANAAPLALETNYFEKS